MAKITEIYQNRNQEKNEEKEYKGKLLKHHLKSKGRIFLSLFCILLIVYIVIIYQKNRTYESYEIIKTIENTDTLSTKYEEYLDGNLKYSKDGASYIDKNGQVKWSQTYTMKNPIICIREESVVVADQQGTQVYIFNKSGAQGTIKTLLPISQVTISEQGVVGTLLDDSYASWIYLYDKKGNKLAEAKCSLDGTGQPLTFDISSDGTKLAISYIQIEGSNINSCLAFYNFGSVGGNFVDKLVNSKIYKDEIIGSVKYLGDSACIAVSDKAFYVYEGKEIPEEVKVENVEEQGEIKSVFYGDGEWGIVQDITARVFNEKGTQIETFETGFPYINIKISKGHIILYNENACEVYNTSGKLKFETEFSGSISNLYMKSSYNRMTFIYKEKTEEVKLR